MLCVYSKTYCCYDTTSQKLKFTSKAFNKRVLEQGSDGLLEKFRKALDDAVNIRSTNRDFRTKDQTVATS